MMGTTVKIEKSVLEVTDDDAAELRYTVTEGPTNGKLHLRDKDGKDNVLVKDGTGTFTQDDLNNKRLSYEQTVTQQTKDGFKFKVDDGKGGEIAETAFNITINPVQGS